MSTLNTWERFIASPRYIQFYRNRLLLEWKSEWTYQSLLILVRYEGTEKWERHAFPLTGHNLADAGHAEHLREPLKQLAHRAPRVDTQTMEIYLVPLTISFGDLFIFLQRNHSAPRFGQMHKIGSIPILHPLLIRDTPVRATSDKPAKDKHAPTKALPAPQSQVKKKRMKLARLAKFYANRFIKRRAQILAGLVIALVRTKRIKIRWLEKRTVPQSITTTNNNDDGKEKQDMKENENNESQETQKPEPTALPSGPAALPAPPAIPAGSETIPTTAEDAGGGVTDIEAELEQLAKSEKPSDAGAANLLLIRQLAEQTEQAARELEARKQLEDAKANIEAAAQKANEAAAQRIEELNRKNLEATLVQQQAEARAKEVEARLAEINQEVADKIARVNADADKRIADQKTQLEADAAAKFAELKQQLDPATKTKATKDKEGKKKIPPLVSWIVIGTLVVLIGLWAAYILRDRQMDVTAESDALNGKSAVGIACGSSRTNGVSSTNKLASAPAPTVNAGTNDVLAKEMEILHLQAIRDGEQSRHDSEQWRMIAQTALTTLEKANAHNALTSSQQTPIPTLTTTNDSNGTAVSTKKNSGVATGNVIGNGSPFMPYAPMYINNYYFGPTNQAPSQTPPPPAHKAKEGKHSSIDNDEPPMIGAHRNADGSWSWEATLTPGGPVYTYNADPDDWEIIGNYHIRFASDVPYAMIEAMDRNGKPVTVTMGDPRHGLPEGAKGHRYTLKNGAAGTVELSFVARRKH